MFYKIILNSNPMKITIYLILLLGFLITSPVFAQENLTKEEVVKYTAMIQEAEGTYQIQMIDTRSLPAIPISIIKTIEEKRKDDETVYFFFKPDTRIKILSRQEIKNKKLTIDEKIIHISSNNL